MATLKLSAIVDERPTKLTIELPASVYRDLQSYGALLANQSGDGAAVDPARLVGPMLKQFMATDRAFTKARRNAAHSSASE